MVLDVKQVASLVVDYMRRNGLPVPAPRDAIYGWAKPLNLPDRGRVLLYTGGLYQLMPYISSLVEQLSKLEKGAASRLALGIARSLGRFMDLSRIAVRPDKRRVEYSNRVLRSIAVMLRRAGVEYAYPYEDDLYSGVILYDLGLDDEFSQHAERVYRALKGRGGEVLITVDPHTTHMMRSVYPKFVDGYDFEVKTYLEVLAEGDFKPLRIREGELVIHDPCLYARFEGVIDQPRKLLGKAGFRVLEPRRARRMTYCCGGPIEGLAPSLSKKIAGTRLEELKGVGKRIVTLCPICYANLTAVADGDVEIDDIAVKLVESVEE